jgi:hypothetical protein
MLESFRKVCPLWLRGGRTNTLTSLFALGPMVDGCGVVWWMVFLLILFSEPIYKMML